MTDSMILNIVLIFGLLAVLYNGFQVVSIVCKLSKLNEIIYIDKNYDKFEYLLIAGIIGSFCLYLFTNSIMDVRFTLIMIAISLFQIIRLVIKIKSQSTIYANGIAVTEGIICWHEINDYILGFDTDTSDRLKLVFLLDKNNKIFKRGVREVSMNIKREDNCLLNHL